MKIPKKLKIGGHKIKVLYPHHFSERSGGLYGQFDHSMNEIRITDVDSSGNKRAESGIAVTFLHEILHAVDFLTGYNKFIENEGFTEGISESLFQVLRDNDLNFRDKS